MSDKNKTITVREALEIAFPDKEITDTVVLDTKNSVYVDDWTLYEDKYRCVDDYLEYLVEDDKKRNIVECYFDYDKCFDEMELNSGSIYEVGVYFNLDDKWELCDIKEFEQNGDGKVLYELPKEKNNERER